MEQRNVRGWNKEFLCLSSPLGGENLSMGERWNCLKIKKEVSVEDDEQRAARWREREMVGWKRGKSKLMVWFPLGMASPFCEITVTLSTPRGRARGRTYVQVYEVAHALPTVCASTNTYTNSQRVVVNAFFVISAFMLEQFEFCLLSFQEYNVSTLSPPPPQCDAG